MLLGSTRKRRLFAGSSPSEPRAEHSPRAAWGLAAILTLALPLAASAAIHNMRATLSGSQVVPPNGSPATGTATIQVDTAVNGLLYHIAYSGLTSSETVSFIHGYAPPGMNAGNRHVLPAGNPKIATWIYPEADEAQILAGNAYVLIHTTGFPAGEIRGQIVRALPPEGSDAFTASAEIQLELYGIGSTTLALTGSTVVERAEPEPNGTRETQAAAIVSLQWSGTNPLLGAVTVRQSALYGSRGSILSAPFTAFPAESHYDVFLEIVTPQATYFNRNRLRIASTIHAIPPLGESYAGDDVLLYRDGNNEGTIAGRITSIAMTPNAPLTALPPAGTDCLDSELHMQLTVNGTGLEHVIGLGPLMLTRGDGVDPGDGRFEAPIEFVALDLGGTGSILGEFHGVEVPSQSSVGIAKSVSPGVAFPVEVELELHAEIHLPTLGRTLVPVAPLQMHGLWNALPQIGIAIDALNMPLAVVDKVTLQPAGTLDFFYVVPDSVCTWAPDAAVETFTMAGNAQVELFGSGTAIVPLSGSGIGARGPGRDTGGGALAAQTEWRSLVASGAAAPVGAITVHEDPARVSAGQITGNAIGSLLPATSTMSAFIIVQTTAGALRPANAVTLVTTAPVTTLPAPPGTTWSLAGGPVDLRSSTGIVRGRLHAWSVVLGTTTPWPTDVAPPSAEDIALDAVLAGVVLERNPVRGPARFRFRLDRARQVTVEIFDARGARVRRLEEFANGSGEFAVEWNGRDDAGREIGTGLYFYRLSVDGRVRSGKLIRLR